MNVFIVSSAAVVAITTAVTAFAADWARYKYKVTLLYPVKVQLRTIFISEQPIKLRLSLPRHEPNDLIGQL